MTWRQLGTWCLQDLEKFTEAVTDIEGDCAEMGVWRGDTFRKLIPISTRQRKVSHDFDSFMGMNEPEPNDNDQ